MINRLFSTINYHAKMTSLSVGTTSLFPFHVNSSVKQMIITNQPSLTSSTRFSTLQQFFENMFCFDTVPISLFNFVNSIIAVIFIHVLILVPTIQERLNQSKDLQLLTQLSKRICWLLNIEDESVPECSLVH
jgi:hypothetical protein